MLSKDWLKWWIELVEKGEQRIFDNLRKYLCFLLDKKYKGKINLFHFYVNI